MIHHTHHRLTHLGLSSLCLTLSVSTALAQKEAESKASRPNILYLYVDDMGWGSIGKNGQFDRKAQGQPYVLTPNLDKLAAAGVNFRRGYGCTVCSPARSSQQTGFHQGYTFADRNDPNNAKKAIRKEDLTMGDVLAKAGYVTGYWGKWGYGGSSAQQNPTLDNLQTLPTSHGYQHVVAELHHVRAHTFFQPTLWTAPAKPGTKGGLELKPNSMAEYQNKKEYSNYPASQNHKDYPQIAYCDDVYAFKALDFIRSQAQNYNKTGQPFFGLFAAQIPHAPFGEVSKLPNWDQDYKDKPYFKDLSPQSQQWCAMVTRIDAHFGNLLQALEDPNGDGDTSDSVADNTLVIFQSDNGGPNGSNRSQLNANGGLSGSKGSIQEGGIRVPTIIRWPAKISANSKLKAGSNSEYVVDCTDLLPTFCDLAGVATPVGLSGVSIASMLEGSEGQRERGFIVHEAGKNASIIKGKYKLVRVRSDAASAKPQNKKKAGKNTKNPKNKKKNNNAAGPKLALYDLEKDPAEKNNIAEQNPELVKELDTLLTAERVDEPAGFANTYHQWTGKNGNIASASHWTKYVYENAGEKYMEVSGSPTLSWIATIPSGEAHAGKDISFLGLEIGGQVDISSSANVTARNEMRVAKGGLLKLNGGIVSSTRWLDIQAGGILRGHGTVQANFYTNGTVELSNPLTISGTANLGGELKLSPNAKVSVQKGSPTVLIKAKAIKGKFTNATATIGGKKYSIEYTQNTVNLVAN